MSSTDGLKSQIQFKQSISMYVCQMIFLSKQQNNNYNLQLLTKC